jgi:hypothetical protein
MEAQINLDLSSTVDPLPLTKENEGSQGWAGLGGSHAPLIPAGTAFWPGGGVGREKSGCEKGQASSWMVKAGDGQDQADGPSAQETYVTPILSSCGINSTGAGCPAVWL